jgi:uncharacterized Zn-finger protein
MIVGQMVSLTEQEIAIICVYLKDGIGRWNYYDKGTMKRRLPEKYRSGVGNTLRSLYNKGFLEKNPKSDDVTYYIPHKLRPDIKEIVNRIDSSTTCEEIKRPEEPEEEREIHPELIKTIESGLSGNVSLLDMIPSEEPIEIETEQQYYKAIIRISVRCPRDSEGLGPTNENEHVIGFLNLYETWDFYCSYCGRKHRMRGVKFVF